MVPFVDAVVAVTVMRVLLFVLHVCMLRECEGARVAASWCDCGERRTCGWTRGSGIVFSAADILGMSVVRGMRGVGGVCEMCLCLARGGEGGGWVDNVWALPILREQGVLGVCLCLGLGCGCVGGVGGEWVGGLDHGLEG